MRTINTFFYLLAAVAFTGLVSCQPEENFKPGKPDNAQCVGVYFPKQDVTSEQQIFSPLDVKHDSIQVSRSDDEDSLKVTLQVSLSYTDAKGVTHPADSNFFKVSEVEFEPGQSDSWVYLDFDDAVEGVAYSLHLSVVGETISSNYSSNLKACDYKVLCVKYIDFVNPKDSTKAAKVTFYQDWWGEVHTGYIKYYEVAGVRHCVTYDEAIDTAACLADGKTPGVDWGAEGFWGTGKNVHLEFDWYVEDEVTEDGETYSHKNSEGYDIITLPIQPVFLHSGYGAVVYFIDEFQWDGTYESPLLFEKENSGLLSWYDGNGGFYFVSRSYYMFGIGGWGGSNPDVEGIAEGFTRSDYTLKLDAGITQQDSNGDNVVPVAFDLGVDVDKVGYTISKGSLSAAQVTKEAAAIAKDTISYSYAHYVDAQGVSFSDSVSVAETGIYTLVAVALDTAKKARSNASVTFRYLAATDANPVVLTVGAGSSEKYASRGYSPETSFEISIAGSGITGAIPMVYTQAEVEAKGGIGAVIGGLLAKPNDFYSILKDEDYADACLSASQLAEVNDRGYVDIYSYGVTPGTQYYFLVWATNGYDYTVDGAMVTTAGDPLPIYQKFTYESRKDDLIDGKNASDFYGTYNLYAVDMNSTATLRSYMGKAKLAAFDEAKYGPIEAPALGEYAQISGLACGKSAGAGFDDTVVLDFCENPYASYDIYDKKGFFVANHSITADSTSAQVFYYSKWNQKVYYAAYNMVGYPVMDGYIAFVAESDDEGYVDPNLYFYNEPAEFSARFKDYLLVDPAKDNNGLAPKTLSKSVAAAKKNAALKGNRVETREGARLSKLDRIKKSVNRNSHVATLEGVKGLQASAAVVRVKASHNVSKAAPKTTKNSPLTYGNVKTFKVK